MNLWRRDALCYSFTEGNAWHKYIIFLKKVGDLYEIVWMLFFLKGYNVLSNR